MTRGAEKETRVHVSFRHNIALILLVCYTEKLDKSHELFIDLITVSYNSTHLTGRSPNIAPLY